jgi:hypothetical protein
MPTVDLNWSKNAAVGVSGVSDFDDAREAAESTQGSTNTTSANILSVRFILSTGRGGAQYGFTRSYLAFDFTGYTTGTITNLAFHWTGTTTSSGGQTVRAVKTTAFGSSTNFSNYVSTDWWDSLDMSTVYTTSGFTWADSTSAQSTSLNSAAITFAQSNSYLQFALVNNPYDYSGINPGTSTTQTSYGNWSSNKMFLRFTYADAAYNRKVNSIVAASSNKIDSVVYTDVSKINSIAPS